MSDTLSLQAFQLETATSCSQNSVIVFHQCMYVIIVNVTIKATKVKDKGRGG